MKIAIAKTTTIVVFLFSLVVLVACADEPVPPTAVPTVDEAMFDTDSDTVSLRFGDEVVYNVRVADEDENEQNALVEAIVTYTDEGGFIQEDVVRLPWGIRFDVMGADRLHIEAELLDGPASRIECTIGTESNPVVERRARDGETICDVDRQ